MKTRNGSRRTAEANEGSHPASQPPCLSVCLTAGLNPSPHDSSLAASPPAARMDVSLLLQLERKSMSLCVAAAGCGVVDEREQAEHERASLLPVLCQLPIGHRNSASSTTVARRQRQSSSKPSQTCSAEAATAPVLLPIACVSATIHCNTARVGNTLTRRSYSPMQERRSSAQL